MEMQMQYLEEIACKIHQNFWDLEREIVVKLPPMVP